MLLVVIVWLRLSTLLLRTFASYENFTARLLFKSLLVKSLWSNNHADVVDVVVLRNVNFLFNLVSVDHCSKVRIVISHRVTNINDHVSLH